MRPKPAQSVDPKAVSLWRIEAVLRMALLGLLTLLGAATLLTLTPFGLVPAVGLLVVFLMLALVQIGFVPQIRYKHWRYQVDAQELDIQFGVFVVRRTLIPLVRVQHVDTVQGPLSKQFGLSSVTVSTAAGGHVIPGLSDEAADSLRDHISALARVARESL
ncbi:MAG TPA: PH domain-containing protein [Polyangiaceae bacterium]|nr:PH domain-containing protein [Polyangiaceae bacterium]